MEAPVTDSTPRLAPEAFAERAQAIEREVGRVIVGQRELVRQTLTGLLANSHVLLEGVPGLGKTMLVRTIADVIDCTFNRIQFTPDLMPADITGTNILIEEGGQRIFRFQPGPIFANLVLADEINRATPKTQSSLLEAMQEHQVTVARQRFPLDPPFFVLATQNPLEMEGTYPAARGAARPLHLQGHGPVPVRGGPDLDHGPHDRLRERHGRPRSARRPRSSRCSGSRGPCRSRRTSRPTRSASSPRPTPTSPARPGSSASTSATAARRVAPRRS